MYFLITILVGLFFIILVNFILNNSKYLSQKVFNFKIYFKKNKMQKLFYFYEKNKNHIELSNKKYFKLNNYIFLKNKNKKKISKIINNDISHLIIVFFSKTNKYFKYFINKNEYNRKLLNNSFNFFKIKINKKSKISIECKKDESILKTFYIKKNSKKKLVLILLLDGLGNHLSKYLVNSKNFFKKENCLNNLWSNSPWTLPTFGNLITGLYTSNHLCFRPVSYYQNKYINQNIESIKSPITIFEFFKYNNFVTGCYSPYIRINPTYNFDRGVDIFKFCDFENTNEITENIINQIELFNGSSNFIFTHLFDMHHNEKGFNDIGDYAHFSDKNFDYKEIIKKDAEVSLNKKTNVLTSEELFLEEKNFFEEQIDLSQLKKCDLALNKLYNYLIKKKFDDFTIILMGDHGSRFRKHNPTSNVLCKNHQNVGLFIKDKKTKSFNNKKNNLIETIDIFPSLISRYSGKRNMKYKLDGKNTIFSNYKKKYIISENIYNKKYTSLINFQNNFLHSDYSIENKTIIRKNLYSFYDSKEKIKLFQNNSEVKKKLLSIEKMHMKNNKLIKKFS